MSEYSPPTESIPIFNSELFNIAETSLTIGAADKRYLKFPTAQGAETIPNLTVTSTTTANNINISGDSIQTSAGGYSSVHKLRLTGYQVFTNSGNLTLAMSGHTIYVNVSGTVINLPSPTNGCFYNIVTAGGSTATTSYFITATGGFYILPQNLYTITLSTDQSIRLYGNGSAWIQSGGYCPQGFTSRVNTQSQFFINNSSNYWIFNGLTSGGSGNDGLFRRYIGAGKNSLVLGNGYLQVNELANGNARVQLSADGSIQTYNTLNATSIGISGATSEITGTVSFPTIPLCTATYTAPTSTSIITKGYADSTYANSLLLASSNTWTGINNFPNGIIIGGNNVIAATTVLTYASSGSLLKINSTNFNITMPEIGTNDGLIYTFYCDSTVSNVNLAVYPSDFQFIVRDNFQAGLRLYANCTLQLRSILNNWVMVGGDFNTLPTVGPTIVGNVTLTYPLAGLYLINTTALAIITLPAISTSNGFYLGKRIIFRRVSSAAQQVQVVPSTGESMWGKTTGTVITAPTTTIGLLSTEVTFAIICTSATTWAYC